jgi:hypothetical protein
LQSLQFRRRGIFGRIVGKDFVVEFCVIFEFVAIFAVQKNWNLRCRIVAQNFVAEFFCYFEFVAIFCSSEEEEFVAEFFCCFEFVVAIFFLQVAEFLFCFGV